MASTKPAAFAVHLFTASGAAFALLALMAAGAGEWRQMFLWLGVGLIVDGIDGPLARRVNIKKNAANWDGVILDLVIDYLTYVFIPAYALVNSDLLPAPWDLLAALLISTTGAIYFADVRMKAADNSFVGFPSVWHMPLLVLFVFQPPAWVTAVTVVALALAQFTPLKFIHPMRTERWQSFNLPVLVLWFALASWSVWVNLDPPAFVRAGLLLTSVWLLFSGIVMQVVREDEN